MLRLRRPEELEERMAGGVRPLFSLGQFTFTETLDTEGRHHPFVIEDPDTAYETDLRTMYELMARYLAGEYEKREYGLQPSPAHGALLDSLELAAARARQGEVVSLQEMLGDLEHGDPEPDAEED